MLTRKPDSRIGGSGGWSLAAFIFLGATAVFFYFDVTTQTDISPIGLAELLCGLVGVVLTLIAVMVGVGLAVRNHQWLWLVVILIGTALPLPVANAAFNAIYPPSGRTFVEYALPNLIGLACTPLAIGIYSAVGLRRGTSVSPGSGRN